MKTIKSFQDFYLGKTLLFKVDDERKFVQTLSERLQKPVDIEELSRNLKAA